jgi:hypothetical protein
LQLDKTQIVIRERSYIDVLDLGLRVFRTYSKGLIPLLAAGAAPLMILNHWLLSGTIEDGFGDGVPASYWLMLLILIFVEYPLATAPATLYLGQAVFAERPEIRRVFRNFAESLPQLLIYQGLLRIFFLRWLYLNEIILLERNPMRRSRRASRSSYSRARQFHRGEGIDLFGRGFSTVAFAGLLFVAIWLSIYMVRAFLLSQWAWDLPMQTFYPQLALWIVIGYFAVVRFLWYLDLRIRREGWEVELLMRAEGTRLAKESQ